MTDEAKPRAMGDFERTYHELERKLRALTPEQLERPAWTGDTTGWRVRDVVAHFATWYRIAGRAAELVAGGKEPPPEAEMRLRAFIGITDTPDEVNDKAYRRWRDRPMAEVFAELRAAHSAFMDASRALPERRILREDGAIYAYWGAGLGHLRAHEAHIEAALKETATP